MYSLIRGVTTTTQGKQVNQRERPMVEWIGTGNHQERVPIVLFNMNTYQWLPSEFHVSDEGKVKILSYINNLHPYKHRNLYTTIAKVFEKFVPWFEKCLEVQPKTVDTNSNRPWFMDKTNDMEDTAPCKLKNRKLQVIVKISENLLTPENSVYSNGRWHTEGSSNEHIVATGIYYFSQDNISDSYLEFKTNRSNNYNDNTVYVTSVKTSENQCIVFPNTYEHQVSTFELNDATKSGHRKMLVFFLIDPKKSIISTAKIPPQQPEWMIEILQTYKCFGRNFPDDVIPIIVNYLSPLNKQCAKQHRDDLMRLRKNDVAQTRSAQQQQTRQRHFLMD